MDEGERARQAALTDAVAAAAELEPGELLTGWVVVWETASVSAGDASCGHLYGPEGMTTWRALGLVEWARRFTLGPDDDDGD